MVKRAILAGAPTGCWTNLGDEAILAAMASSLRAIWPRVSLAVVSSNPPGFLDRYDCEAVPFRDVEALAEAVAASDLVLLGGGSIFFDYWGCDPGTILTPRHQGLSLWASVALLAAAHARPSMVYGAGVGPLHTADGELLTRAVFELAQAVCVRDQGSLATLRALIGEGVAATVTGDVALSSRLPPAPTLDLPRPWVGVALRQWDVEVDDEAWQAETAAALDRFLERHGGTALFVPCHRAVSWPLTDDTGAGEAVRVRMQRRDRTHAVDVDLPWTERAALLAGCDVVLAMRYHAALFGLAAGIPTVALSYDPKVESLLADWEFEALCVRLGDVRRGGGEPLLHRAYEERESWSAIARRRAAQLREDERGNARTAQRVAAEGPGTRPVGAATAELLSRLDDRRDGRPAAAARALGSLRRQADATGGARQAASVVARTDGGGRPKRVAILTNRLLDRQTGAPCIGGAERYALELGRLLADLGLRPTFFQRGGDWEEGVFHGFPVIGLPRGESFSEFEPGVAQAFFERTRDFDHVLCLMPNYASGPLREDAIVVCHGVWWDHDLYRDGFSIRSPEWYEHLERVFARARRVVSVDANSISVVRALFPAAAERMKWIPSWVDTERFRPPAERSSEEPRVLFPRRADVVRGTRLIAPILERLPDRCRVLWAGDGHRSEVEELRRVAAQDARFELRSASFEEMPGLYRDADICVIPSVGSEGQSLSCLEAMASGCAVVATRVGGLPELIRDGVDGLLCDPTPEAIAGAIRRLLEDRTLRRRLGTAARATAERQSLTVWRRRWAALFAEQGWVERTCPAIPYDIVCFPVIDWEFRWQRPQQMMALWGRRGRRVFFLRISDFLPPDHAPAARGAREPIAVTPLAENVWEVRIALPEGFNAYDGRHPEGFVTAGLEALRALRESRGVERAVSIIELASWTPLAAAARDAFDWPVVYDCMDDWSNFPGMAEKRELRAWEEELVDSADVMVASSATIEQRWHDRRPDLLVARNAADFELFHDADGEDPLPDVEGPVAGFFGAIAEWFDDALLAQVAKARPEVTFILVGGVHRTSIDELAALPNVRLEGQRPYEAMPLYLRRFDACLVPFEVSPVTDGMDVVKFYEYISQGKPVVATPIREIRMYEPYLYLAADAESFVSQLDRALAEDDPALRERRIALARGNTWGERLDRIEAAVLERLAQHMPAPPRPDGCETEYREAPRPTGDPWRAEAERLRGELARWHASRLWRVAQIYWRGRRAVGRALGRRPPASSHDDRGTIDGR